MSPREVTPCCHWIGNLGCIMLRVRACTAIAVWISLMFLMSACSIFEILSPVATVQIPQQPPPSPPPPPQRAEPPAPEQAYAEIVRWFSAAGYQKFQVEALAEHARTESGFRPCAAGPAG